MKILSNSSTSKRETQRMYPRFVLMGTLKIWYLKASLVFVEKLVLCTSVRVLYSLTVEQSFASAT